MYHCLTGKPPFVFKEAVAVLLAHVNTPAPRVSETVPDIPKAIDDLIAKMLAKRPENRPKDLEAVIRQLDGFGGMKIKDWGDFTPPNLGFRQAVDRTSDFSRSEMRGLDLPESTMSRPWLSADGGVVYIDDQAHLSLYDVEAEKTIALKGDVRKITAVLNTDSGMFAATSTGDIFRWENTITDEPSHIAHVDEHIYAMVETAPGIFILGTKSGALVLMNTQTKATKTLLQRSIPLKALAKSPAEPRVLFEYSKRRLGMWDYATGAKIALRQLEASPISIAVCRSGYLGAVLDDAGTLEVFTIPYGEVVHREALDKPLTSIAFNEKNDIVGLVLGGKRFELWKAALYGSQKEKKRIFQD